ncbi:MAG TPA: ABC transporter ATP-binding protein [Polyangiaceae bacterium]|nr:ABC transporter ATP-binding protein [Polyangiaceae bacterium]
MKLAIRSLCKSYVATRGTINALSDIQLLVAAAEFVSLVGTSGCGKSTLLHIVGGLEAASSGTVELDGERVRGPGAELGLVLQHQTLFPWLTVLENVRFPYTLRHQRVRPAADEELANRALLVENLLRLVGLWDFRNSYPAELSGGMQQRAAIARALVARPDVLLMDEPFGALDSQTREEMQELLLHVNALHRTTTLFVTHDVDEALLLSDRVVVLSPRPGRIIGDIRVPFARDRRAAELKLDPDFVQLKRQVMALLRHQTDRGSALQSLNGR